MKLKRKVLSGSKLAGGDPKNGRVENDYYATDPKAVEMLLNNYDFNASTILEPCVGGGHIAKVLRKEFPEASITCLDLVDRGYPDTIVKDFLKWRTDKRFDCIISNPPYSLAQEFIEKSLKLLRNKGKIAMFLNIRFLESSKRKDLFDAYPPKYIYVFRNRMATWNNGNPVNPDTGKKWATTLCHAWFIWEKNSKTEPIVRWLD